MSAGRRLRGAHIPRAGVGEHRITYEMQILSSGNKNWTYTAPPRQVSDQPTEREEAGPVFGRNYSRKIWSDIPDKKQEDRNGKRKRQFSGKKEKKRNPKRPLCGIKKKKRRTKKRKHAGKDDQKLLTLLRLPVIGKEKRRSIRQNKISRVKGASREEEKGSSVPPTARSGFTDELGGAKWGNETCNRRERKTATKVIEREKREDWVAGKNRKRVFACSPGIRTETASKEPKPRFSPGKGRERKMRLPKNKKSPKVVERKKSSNDGCSAWRS